MQTLISLPQIVQAMADDYATENPEALEKLNGRFTRGVQYAKEGRIQATDDPNIFHVQSSGTNHYVVNTQEKSCNCPDAAKKNVCKHRIAVHFWTRAHEEMRAAPAEAQPAPEGSIVTSYTPVDEIARAVQDYRRSTFKENTEALTYGIVEFGGQQIPVEIVGLLKSVIYVSALPSLENGQLTARYPFPSPLGNAVPYGTAELKTSHITYANVIREDNTTLYGTK